MSSYEPSAGWWVVADGRSVGLCPCCSLQSYNVDQAHLHLMENEEDIEVRGGGERERERNIDRLHTIDLTVIIKSLTKSDNNFQWTLVNDIT